jgi:hypothetical protein
MGGGEGSGASGSDGNLARSVVDHALRYRAQRPMVDALLKEVGLGDIADLNGLVDGPGTTRESSGPDRT